VVWFGLVGWLVGWFVGWLVGWFGLVWIGFVGCLNSAPISAFFVTQQAQKQ
jgi:hypothetical protein